MFGRPAERLQHSSAPSQGAHSVQAFRGRGTAGSRSARGGAHRMLSLAALIVLVAIQPTDPLAAANKAFAEKDWPRAAELYRSVVQTHPDQASSWARLGRSLREAGRAREALPALQKAEQLGFFPPLMQYQRALAHAHLGEKDAALALLKPLVDQEFGPPPGLPAVDADPAVAKDPRFKELAAKFAALTAPC